jgi:hypothetical protein
VSLPLVHRLFRSRAFVAAAMALLLGAVRCADACRLMTEDQPVKPCHRQGPQPKQVPPSPCAHLAFEANPGATKVAPFEPVFLAAMAVPLPVFPLSVSLAAAHFDSSPPPARNQSLRPLRI